MNFSDSMMRCKYDGTVASFLEVEGLINADVIMESIDIEERRNRAIDAIKNIDFRKYLPEQFLDQLLVCPFSIFVSIFKF